MIEPEDPPCVAHGCPCVCHDGDGDFCDFAGCSYWPHGEPPVIDPDAGELVGPPIKETR